MYDIDSEDSDYRIALENQGEQVDQDGQGEEDGGDAGNEFDDEQMLSPD